MALILGGGPAGAAAAITLAANGARSLVVERQAGDQDAICGGFLSWRTCAQLDELGVDPAALGGHPVTVTRLFARDRAAEFALPAPGIGLSRRTLDAALLARAADLGAEVRRGVNVRAVEDGSARLADGTVLHDDHVLLATGKHDVRGAARPVSARDPAMGLRWRFAASPALALRIAGAVELHLFDHGYAGLVLQEDGHANLCLAVRRSAFVAAGQRPEALLAALLGEHPALQVRIEDEQLGAAQAIANVPYGWRADADDAHGLYRVGDQAGVIPSLAGEGVGIALATGAAAAHAVLGQVAPDRFQAATSRRLRRPIGTAQLLWQAAERPSIARAALPLIARAPGLVDRAMRATRVAPADPIAAPRASR